MRKSMIENSDSVRYSKEQDDLEKWLLKIIQRYFLTETNYSKTQEEAIIVESVRRAKEYLQDHGARVFSFNGKAGVLKVDARFFGGESAFEKKTAFNKDFGINEDTICRGNDERLYDPREPLYHVHNVFDIEEIKNLVNEYLSNEDIKYVESFTHSHSNKDVLDKIRYSGSQDKFDLALIESSYLMLLQYEELVRSISLEVEFYLRKYLGNVGAIKEALIQVLNDINAVRDAEPAWPREAKNYTENRIRDLKDLFAAWILNYLKKDELQAAIDYLESSYILTGEINYSPIEVLDLGIVEEQDTSEDIYPVPIFDITGIVYDDYTRAPLPGVTVTMNGITVISDSNGSYTFTDMLEGTYVLSYSIQGYISETKKVSVSFSSVNVPNVYLRYVDITLTVIVTENGSGLSGVSNSISGIGTATTNSSGTCTFTVRPYTQYTITSSKSDYVTKTTTITTSRNDTSVSVTLEPMVHTVTVIVKDSVNNNLISGATVTINGITGTTGSSGSFSTQLRSGSYNVSVSKTGYNSADGVAIVSGSDKDVEVFLEAANGSITGRVINTKTNGSVDGVTVTIAGTSISTTTDNDGYFTLQCTPGTYSLVFTKTAFETNNTSATNITVSSNQTRDVGTIGLTPQLNADTYEVNIMWTYDTDLDTHAIGVIGGQNINISYSNKTAYINNELVASLDTDTTHITTGIGGENLTLVMNSANDYINVYLYNYSKNVPISSCGVTFKVSMGPNTVGTYNVSGGTISDTTASSSGASTTSALYIARISPNGVTINNTYTSEA